MQEEGRERSWSEAVEDLVQRDDVDGAIEVLESLLSRIGCSDLAPAASSSFDDASRRVAASAMGDLANLLDSRGSSMRADELRRQIIILREEIDGARGSASPANTSRESEVLKEGNPDQERGDNSSDDVVDDWETAADLPLPDIVGISRSQEPEIAKPESPTRRRGRGHFQYKKDGLYSDQINESDFAGPSNSEEDSNRRETSDLSSSRSASLKHVLVLQDFPQSIRTTDLEKIFESFSEDGVAIRWVHDTCALAVFRTPSAASRALSSTSCQFKVRMIEDTSDAILSQISSKDLEPPILRPRTSARTAQRMIAQSMGIKVNSSFGAKELRIQERERRSRIQARQDLKDDAWGSDDP